MTKKPVLLAILAAVFYGASFPFSKLLLESMPPVLMASFIYFGAGIGMAVVFLAKRGRGRSKEARLTKKDLPFTVAMVGLDIAAPILLMFGLSMTTSATASLLNNFEIVATAVVALVVFKEAVGRRMWLAIVLITLSCVLLSVEDFSSLTLSAGAILVLLACVCWGIENNCTRMLSLKNPVEIVAIKGIGAGFGSLVIALAIGEVSAGLLPSVLAVLLGFVSYGLSIYFYILAQRGLGAARTSAYYAIAPFVGVLLSFVVFRTGLSLSFGIALVVMSLGAYFAASERHSHKHAHAVVTHEHRHDHSDSHHQHTHPSPSEEEHSHVHTHESFEHSHAHTPDLHHQHAH